MTLPIVIQEAALSWETWPDATVAARSGIVWKDLIRADRTASQALSLGLGHLPAGQVLTRHWHAAPEVYYIVRGTGVVSIAADAYPVAPGTAVFLPANAPHELKNTGATPLEFIYVFPIDSPDELEYHFPALERS